jgi:hypothetical protein
MYVRSIRKHDGSKPSASELNQLMRTVERAFKSRGYECRTQKKSVTAFMVSDIRLSQSYINRFGYNVSPWTGRRGRILGWDNWVEVNNLINAVFDNFVYSAKIDSLGGKFKIRDGNRAYTERDWDPIGWENAGSMMRPITRRDMWLPED